MKIWKVRPVGASLSSAPYYVIANTVGEVEHLVADAWYPTRFELGSIEFVGRVYAMEASDE